jgi:hypothetical protein
MIQLQIEQMKRDDRRSEQQTQLLIAAITGLAEAGKEIARAFAAPPRGPAGQD